jgi:hypothetical protein
MIPFWLQVTLIAAAASAVLVLAFQFIANSIVKELRPDSGSTIRDAIDRLEKSALSLQASTARLEEAGKEVARELKLAQGRAMEVKDGDPGEAADAAVRPEVIDEPKQDKKRFREKPMNQ